MYYHSIIAAAAIAAAPVAIAEVPSLNNYSDIENLWARKSPRRARTISNS